MPRPIHPWDKWFKRRRLTLRRNKEYTCQSYAMAIQFRREAKRRDCHVSIETYDNEIRVEITR